MSVHNLKHIVIRYSDKFGATVELHNKVVSENGYVWFGKMGTGLSTRWIRVFESQLANGFTTWLYVVKRDGMKYSFHKARVVEILKNTPTPDIAVPDYYRTQQLMQQMSCFFKIDTLRACSRHEVEEIRLASSGSPVTETLGGSMNGMFIVVTAG